MPKPSDTLARLRARSVEAGRFVLPLDQEWADKLADAYDRRNKAEFVEDADQIAAARAEVAKLEELAGDNVMVFRFRRLSKPDWEALVARNPLSAEQRAAQEKLPAYERKSWNQETFVPDLIATTCIEPRFTLEEATELINGTDEDGNAYLSGGEAAQLGNAAANAATSVARAPKDLRLP